MFELSKEFFHSPLEQKEAVSISSNKAGKNHGWLSQGVEKLDPATQQRPDVKEAFNLGGTYSSLFKSIRNSET
jgi:isopenicillin N synthase-like dioxygenase